MSFEPQCLADWPPLWHTTGPIYCFPVQPPCITQVLQTCTPVCSCFFPVIQKWKHEKKFSQKSHSRCLLTVSRCAGTNTNSWEPQHHKSQTAYWRITGAAKSPLAALAFSKCSTSSQSGLHMLNSTITWTLHKCMPGFHTLSFMWCQMKMITMRALNRWMLYFSFGKSCNDLHPGTDIIWRSVSQCFTMANLMAVHVRLCMSSHLPRLEAFGAFRRYQKQIPLHCNNKVAIFDECTLLWYFFLQQVDRRND